MNKAYENTPEFILDAVAPVFNKKGYVGTSLRDITEATGLTKGAVYCNFLNKEDLALKAFRRNIERILDPLRAMMRAEKNAHGKLTAIVRFYANYFEVIKPIGGCPLNNVGVDSKNLQPELFEEVKKYILMLIESIVHIVTKGQKFGEIRETVDAEAFAKNLYVVIDGGLFIAVLLDDKTYLTGALEIAQKNINDIILYTQQG